MNGLKWRRIPLEAHLAVQTGSARPIGLPAFQLGFLAVGSDGFLRLSERSRQMGFLHSLI